MPSSPTTSELASYLQSDLDSATATLALAVAWGVFQKVADTRFESTAVTYTQVGRGESRIVLPFRPIIAVSAVRVAGTVVPSSEYRLIRHTLYRAAGFGSRSAYYPPDLVEVDLTHGYTTVPDDVKGAVLETAAAAYQGPDVTVVSEQIDDYAIRSAPNAGGVSLTPAAAKLAYLYRFGAVA